MEQVKCAFCQEDPMEWTHSGTNLFKEYSEAQHNRESLESLAIFMQRIIFKFAVCCGRVEVQMTNKMTARENMSIFGITELKLDSTALPHISAKDRSNDTAGVSQSGVMLDREEDLEMDILQKFAIQAIIYKEVELLKPENRAQRIASTNQNASESDL